MAEAPESPETPAAPGTPPSHDSSGSSPDPAPERSPHVVPPPPTPSIQLTRPELASPPGSSPLGALGLVALLVVGVGIGLFALRSPAPTAGGGPELARASALLERGERVEGARVLAAIVQDPTLRGQPVASDAAARLSALARASVDEKRPLGEVAALLGLALEATPESAEEVGLVTSATVTTALSRVEAEAAKDPRGACELTARLGPALEGTPLLPAWKAARARALEAALARDPKGLEARVGLADLELDAGKAKEARERLEPFAGEVGSGEGARVLGLARARTGAKADAVAPLGSYLDAHLPAFARATAETRAVLEQTTKHALADLEQGRAPPAFTKAYRAAATDKDRQRLIDSFIGEASARDPAVRAARRALFATTNVVHAALQLGSLEVESAQGRPAAERQSHLERAERLFLAVKEVAGGESAWWLFVGRLQLSLGKAAEGRKTLDTLLVRQHRAVPVLLTVARVHAEAQSFEAARSLAEEAFSAATSQDEKEAAAHLRAQLAASSEEQIEWLGKAGRSPGVLAMLARARSQQALEEGRFEDARAALDELIPPAAATGTPPLDGAVDASHAAVFLLDRAEATGRREDLDAAIAALEQAGADVAAPLDVLDALSSALVARAVWTTVGERLRLPALHERVSAARELAELVELVAASDAERVTLSRTFTEDRDLRRALELREKVLARDPSRPGPYLDLLALALARHDAAEIARLTARLETASPDRAEEAKQVRRYWSGADDARFARAVEQRRKRADRVLALARATNDPLTLARALTARALVERDAIGVGLSPDHEKDVSLCEEAARVAPRRYTRLAFRNALLARAAERLRRGSAALDAVLQKYPKLGTVTLLACAVKAEPGLVATLAADPDVKRAVEVHGLVESERPLVLGTHDQVVFALVGDPRADETRARVAASEIALVEARASYVAAPESPESVLELATVLELRGELAARDEALAAAKAAGVSLPESSSPGR